MAPFDKYISAIEREIDSRGKSFFKEGATIKSIYFGGGTPSLLSPKHFSRICRILQEKFDLSQVEEFTVEVNPDDIASENGYVLLEEYIKCGVNRISMGVQSFYDPHLKWMNRRHSVEDIYSAFSRLREVGFKNISIDLIFGFSGISSEQWVETIKKAIDLSPDHISAYQMSIDADSTLAELVATNKYIEPEEEICAEQYSTLQTLLAEAGYFQYEISSFCKPGFQSKHNSSYWSRAPYLGLGAAAHSFDGENLRQWNISSVDKYCDGVSPEEEVLSDIDIYNEKIMLGLRTAIGVPANILNRNIAERFLLYNSSTDRFAIPPEKFFICDSIISNFIITEDD